MKLTAREINRWLKYWQKRLSLQDWSIDWEWRRAKQLGHPRRSAEISWNNVQEATLGILPGTDRYQPWEMDPEVDLVHELVHLKLSRAQFTLEEDLEWAVDSIARALVNERRGLK